MTMNYTSYTPFFSSSIRADDDFMSPIRPGRGIHEAAAAEGRDWDETYDLAALLPADPFGMNLSSTLSAFADFMRDFGAAAGGPAGGYEFYFGDASAFGHWMDEEPSASEEAPAAREEEEAASRRRRATTRACCSLFGIWAFGTSSRWRGCAGPSGLRCRATRCCGSVFISTVLR
ncbi:F-box protein SKIP14-like [Iris pallida]|uniref:F-box protein SKIP14-like n=1 Tax=Iris pallida TaxID=29817 RepID=A0AAX6G8P6_IRIPA|nr:F-box protein SKIP14-like [Iris pallida]